MTYVVKESFEPVGEDSFRSIARAHPELMKATLDQAGKMLAKALRDTIAAQPARWEPHGPETIERKMEPHGSLGMPSNFPTDVWRDFGVLWGNIRYRGYGSGLGYSVGVGLFEDAGDRVAAAANLEYGGNTEARPLFRPVTEEMRPKLLEQMEQEIEGVLEDAAEGRF